MYQQAAQYACAIAPYGGCVGARRSLSVMFLSSRSARIGVLHVQDCGSLAFALTLAACDAVNTVTEGASHARAVESDLERTTGMKPRVGYNWNNGRLVSVTVQYPRLIESERLGDLAKAVRSSVSTQFKQTPENIVLAFSLGK